jgi:uncharacterized protein YkwD
MFSPRRAFALLVSLSAVALAGPAGAQAADCPGADVVPAAGNTPVVAQATLCLLNAERAAQGMAPVAEVAGLTAPSAAYSDRMVAEHFFAHESPDGGTLTDRLTGAGYVAPDGDWVIGENIAWGQGELSTPRSIVAAWMASPGHRANILTREYDEIGIGVTLGTPSDPSWGATYTTDFGAVQRDAPAAAAPSRAAVAGTKRTSAKAKRTTVKRCSTARARTARTARTSAKTKARRAATTCARAASVRRSAR